MSDNVVLPADQIGSMRKVGRPKGSAEPISVRLERHSMPVTETGCWIWIGELCDLGYGRLKIDGKAKKAHRISWQINKGQIPPGMKVLHRCDVRSCINPDHLFIGTQADNVRDMDMKGRRAPNAGQLNANAKLTNQQVLEIRTSSLGCMKLAEKYNVGKSTINYIKNRVIWKHL